MARYVLTLFVVLAVCALPACKSTDGNKAATIAPDRHATQTASPIEDYRHERLRQAMAGLSYDSGRVAVDEEFAATIATRGDHDAAAAEYELGEDLLLEQNDRIGAIAAFTRAVLIWPEEARFYDGLGRALLWKGKASEAIAAFRTGLDLEPQSVELHFLLADTLNRIGDAAGATAGYETVLELDPGHAAAHGRLARLCYYAGDDEGAWRHIAAAEQGGEVLPAQLPLLLKGQMPRPTIHRLTGPQIGAQVRIDVAGGTYASNETTIASVEQTPLEVVAAWNDWRDSTSYEVVRMGVAVSLDGGANWTDFTVRPPGPNQSGVEGDPMTCYDNRTGTLWVGAISFSGNGGVYVARKIPGSASFEPSVMARATGSADKCWMAAGVDPNSSDQTRVYIAYNQGSLYSTDLGDTWSGPVSLGSGIGFLPRVGPNGEVYVAYWDFGYGVKMARSYDGGLSFTTHTIATRMDTWSTQDGSRFPGRFRVPALNYLAVDPNDGTLYCIYFDTTNSSGGNYNTDLYFTKSTNQGTNWTTPVVINGDANPPGDQFWPWLEVDQQGRIHVLFYDTRHTVQSDNTEHGMFDAYYMASNDGGASWAEYRLTPQPFDSYYDGLPRSSQFMGDYLGLAVAGNRVYPCYPDSQNLDTDVYTNVIVYPSGIVGDVNCDGEVNGFDIDPFVLVMGTSQPYDEYYAQYPNCDHMLADINGDGDVNGFDIDAFVDLLGG
ncbi:MAG: hypothetical protein KKB50_06785 [Planctomycetes bacterium]|nr:hypothetical protein [Planctomycetota bacterium]